MSRTARPSARSLLGLGLLVVLVVAMALNTRFVTPKELASIGPQKFDPAAAAAKLYTKARGSLGSTAAPLPEVVKALQQDPKKAAETYHAVEPTPGTLLFAVTGKGTVTQASAESITLRVDGVPAQTLVIVPFTTALNGTVVRDAMGFKFADAPGQSAYQFVGDELKKLMSAAATKGLGGSPAQAKGKQVTVTGIVSVQDDGQPVPAAKPVNIQPVELAVG